MAKNLARSLHWVDVRSIEMKKAILGFLSVLLVFASVWGVNSLNGRSRSRQRSDTTMWV
jgi:hypothetical protein